MACASWVFLMLDKHMGPAGQTCDRPQGQGQRVTQLCGQRTVCDESYLQPISNELLGLDLCASQNLSAHIHTSSQKGQQPLVFPRLWEPPAAGLTALEWPQGLG